MSRSAGFRCPHGRTEIPSYLPLVFAVVVLIAVARLIYRLDTDTPTEATQETNSQT